MIDPCGQAGGKYLQTPVGGASMFGTVTINGTRGTQTLKMGDLGSKVLPPSDPKSVPDWKVGSTPRVAWGMRFNHGGTFASPTAACAPQTRAANSWLRKVMCCLRLGFGAAALVQGCVGGGG